MSTRFATTGPEGPQLGVNDAANLRTQFAALRADLIKALSGDYLVESAALAIGSTTTAVANGAFTFVINGVQYQETADAVGTAPGNDVIPQGTYGAVALDIGADGTIDVIEAGDNATGYASAALAIAGIAAAAADHVRMGTVTATKSDGAFTFGTTALDAANTTVAYTSTPIFGLDASLTSSDLTGA
jgi:hypothetical protein